MANQSENEGTLLLESLSDTIGDAIKEDKDIVDKLEALQIDTIKKRLRIKIKDGHGSWDSGKQTSLWHHATGNATIVEPDNGDWHIVVKDTVQKKTIADWKNLKKGERKNIDYKAGWSIRVLATADWSEKADTTLVIDIEIN